MAATVWPDPGPPLWIRRPQCQIHRLAWRRRWWLRPAVARLGCSRVRPARQAARDARDEAAFAERLAGSFCVRAAVWCCLGHARGGALVAAPWFCRWGRASCTLLGDEHSGGGSQRHGSWSRGGGAAPDGLPCLWSMSAKLFACNLGLDCSGRKLLPTFLLVEMTTAPKGIVPLLWASSWIYFLVARGSLGENPVQILDERRQSLLASCPSWRCRL